MKCPACNVELRPGVVLFCERCWWLIPANDRQQLAAMYRRNGTNVKAYESKLLQCTRYLQLSDNTARSKRIDARVET